MEKYIYVVVSLFVASSGVAFAKEEKVVPKKVDPIVEEVKVNGKSPSVEDAENKSVVYRDIIKFARWKCDVNWDEECEGSQGFKAPTGYQVCNFIYTVEANRGYTERSSNPADWYTGDPEDPDRYRGYGAHILARGSNMAWDRWGSNITLINVGIRVIKAEATNPERYAAGCFMPPH